MHPIRSIIDYTNKENDQSLIKLNIKACKYQNATAINLHFLLLISLRIVKKIVEKNIYYQ